MMELSPRARRIRFWWRADSALFLFSVALFLLAGILDSGLPWAPAPPHEGISAVALLPLLVAVVLILLGFLLSAVLLSAYNRNARTLMPEFWEYYKQHPTFFRRIRVDPTLPLLAGERIVIPLSTAFVDMRVSPTFIKAARDIIVTDKRICVGALWGITGPGIARQKETFGLLNFWHPSFREPPALPTEPLLGRIARGAGITTCIDSVQYHDDELGGSVELASGASRVTISHPRAREIYGLFSRPVQA